MTSIKKIWDKTSKGKRSQCASIYSVDGIFPTINAGTHGYSMGQIYEPQDGQRRELLHRQQLSQGYEYNTQVQATAGYDDRGGDLELEVRSLTDMRTEEGKEQIRKSKTCAWNCYVLAPRKDEIATCLRTDSKSKFIMIKTTVAYSKSTRETHIDIRGKVDGEANTISTGDGGANMSSQNFVAESSPIRIRKLTPIECERLQGYPDNHTQLGRKEDGTIYTMSNTQRYKQCGNGVSSPVAAMILTTLIPDESVSLQSLFSGILGTELDLPERFKLTGTCEFDKYASDVIRFHHPDVPNFQDVTKFVDRTDVAPFDLLTFGFPCQSFSIAGLRQGFEDDKGRGTLIYNVFDILEKHKPKYFMAENVAGLLNHDKGKTFIQILTGLSQLGYELDFELVNSKHYGLAQNRQRVFIFGKLKK